MAIITQITKALASAQITLKIKAFYSMVIVSASNLDFFITGV